MNYNADLAWIAAARAMEPKMKWYHYLAAFFAGAFLTNAAPHFVNGISGNPFPTPFATPPGKGLSSPLTNVLWALANLLLGCTLLKVSKMSAGNKKALLVFFIGVAFISVLSSIVFADKAKL
jgi:drug/metabolite transporter (DMT)-like permease